VIISQSRPMIELRDLPTEGGRESVPVSRTLLNHPVSYARQNRPCRCTLMIVASERSRQSHSMEREVFYCGFGSVMAGVAGLLPSTFQSRLSAL